LIPIAGYSEIYKNDPIGISDSLSWIPKIWFRSPDSSVWSIDDDNSKDTYINLSNNSSQDWLIYFDKIPVKPGQVWKTAVSTKLQIIGPSGKAGLEFVLFGENNQIINFDAGYTEIIDSGSEKYSTSSSIIIPDECRTIQPRIKGKGYTNIHLFENTIYFDSTNNTLPDTLTLATDSLIAVISTRTLGMKLSAKEFPKYSEFSGIDWLSVKRIIHLSNASLSIMAETASGDSVSVVYVLTDLGLEIILEADPELSIPNGFQFPGSPKIDAKAWIAIPFGSGMKWPASGPSRNFDLYVGGFSEGVTGAIRGNSGFGIFLENYWSTRLELKKNPDSILTINIIQQPELGKFGAPRILLLSVIKSNGWTELAKRYRKWITKFHRVKTLREKSKLTPASAFAGKVPIDYYKGTIKFWPIGDWKRYPSAMIDTLKWAGLYNIIIEYAPNNQLDTLISKGVVVSQYSDFADAFPYDPNDPLLYGYNGWLSENIQGDYIDGFEKNGLMSKKLCGFIRPTIAYNWLVNYQSKKQLNGRFIDVELADPIYECWSKTHPLSRTKDVEGRISVLAAAKDSFGLVVGSELGRDFGFGVVDYCEGLLTQGRSQEKKSWNLPVSLDNTYDSANFNFSTRLPLIQLSYHDVVLSTWWTGDGQSKVRERWNEKDVWTLLYGGIPIIIPIDTVDWKQNFNRYLRSIIPSSALLYRIADEEMINFQSLTADESVQRTTFSNNWSITANLGANSYKLGDVSLPQNGYFASNGIDQIARKVSDESIYTIGSLDDRWFVFPESCQVISQGVSTSIPITMNLENIKRITLGIHGSSNGVLINTARLNWVSDTIRIQSMRTGLTVMTLANQDKWIDLRALGERYYTVSGNFTRNAFDTLPIKKSMGFQTFSKPTGFDVFWYQDNDEEIILSQYTMNGKVISYFRIHGSRGENVYSLPKLPGISIISLKTKASTETRQMITF